MNAAIKAYVTLIKNKKMAFSDVDPRFKDKVKQALKDAGLEELIQE